MPSAIERQTAEMLAALDAKDPYTRLHSERVGMLMGRFAAAMSLPLPQAKEMTIAGLLHDTGKLDTPNELLEKISQGEPFENDAHKEEMKRHVEAARIAHIDLPATVRLAIRHHHEKWDGSGYPDGLAGTDIPPTARMLAVCDVYDAISAERPQRKALAPRKAAAALRKLEGSKLDPKLTEVFIRKVAEPGANISLLERLLRFFSSQRTKK